MSVLRNICGVTFTTPLHSTRGSSATLIPFRNLRLLERSRAHTAALKNVTVGDAVQDFNESHHLRAMVRVE